MKSLNELYSTAPTPPASPTPVPAASPTPVPPASPTPVPEAAATEKKDESPVIETPPGLPMEYVEINLKNQPLPSVLDMASITGEEVKPLNVRLMPGVESIINATDIPYSPGKPSRVVQDRIDQGPRVFVSRLQRDKFEKDFHEEKSQEPQAGAQGPTIAHPDTLKPGTFITGESRVYRPG